MKSIQINLRVDPTKQQLLENRLNPILSPIINTTSTSLNIIDSINRPIYNQSELSINNQSSSAETINNNNNEFMDSQRLLSLDNNENNNSSSSINIINNNIDIVDSLCLNNINNNIEVRETPQAVRHTLGGVRRRKKSKIESPHNKKFCNRTEKRIDEIFKSLQSLEPLQVNIGQANYIQQPLLPITVAPPPLPPPLSIIVSPHRNSCSDSSGDSLHDNHLIPAVISNNNINNVPAPSIQSTEVNVVKENSDIRNETVSSEHHTPLDPIIAVNNNNTTSQSSSSALLYNNNNTNTINQSSDSLTSTLRRKIQSLEQEIDSLQKENEKDVEYRKKSREMHIKTLIQLSELERRATKDRVTQNMLQLGQFKPLRQGAHYEEKWCEGVKYQDLDKRKKMIDRQREENEKNKKIWNKRKPSKQKGSPELEPNEFYSQAEIHDIRKLNINKEEKEIQAENDRLDRERNLHIREIKRLNNEEASRFRDFPILNDRYLILSLLGKGGFSEVHKSFDLEQLCFVACKIHELAPNWPQDKKDSYIKHALREISIHKSLDHNRIVKVHDVFNIDNDAFCTVLEYCEGHDLDFFLKQNKCVGEREAKSIICQLVTALRYLNDRKNPIIHYDLKPGNILFNNNSGEVKITDFGLSKIFPDDHHNHEEGMELTSQGAGTYWYLPPECFMTDGNSPPTISSKVDVWSLGVIFYQCLYGRKPFGNNMTQTDILHNNTILQARFITFPSNPKVSDAAKDFIKKCCTYRKEHRPDVFQLCNEDYLKPKAQLKQHSVEVPSLPGPSLSLVTQPPPPPPQQQATTTMLATSLQNSMNNNNSSYN